MTSNEYDPAAPGTVSPPAVTTASARGAAVRPHYSARRAICGAWWAVLTVLAGGGAVVSLFEGHFLQFLAGAAFAGLAGWYDYRVWTLRAKWLMFLIIF